MTTDLEEKKAGTVADNCVCNKLRKQNKKNKENAVTCNRDKYYLFLIKRLFPKHDPSKFHVEPSRFRNSNLIL